MPGQGLGSSCSSRTVRLVQPLEDAPDDGKYWLQAIENIWTISTPALGADPALPAVQVVEGVLVPAARAAQNLAARAAVVPPPHHREPGHGAVQCLVSEGGFIFIIIFAKFPHQI